IRRSIAEGMTIPRLSPLSRIAEAQRLSLEELIHEIETEPALAALVLREANLGREDSPTAILHEACLRLGADNLRKISACIELSAAPPAEREQLWEQALRTAEAARLLAEETAIMSAEEAYTLGLLHDAGEALLGQLFPAEMEQIGANQEERCEKERALFGVDHAQVGQWLLEACGVPRHLTSAVQTHHDITRINSPAALLLHVADAIAQADSPYEVAALGTIDTDQLYMLGINRNGLFRIYACVGSAIEQRIDPVFPVLTTSSEVCKTL
ncbi:MAG: HDOD domain-containing protein, partial [Acidobacteriota bacterium]|nr:HDOD domain-containing protein [Acidobacteriota bacterium]